MSSLPGRLAATEGAFFNQHSKQAAIALKQKLKNSTPNSASSTPESNLNPSQADVLPEVLRHSLPIVAELQADTASAPAPSSLAASLKLKLSSQRVVQDGVVRTGAASIKAVDHLASVPQTSLGRKKWNIDAPDVQVVASTANDIRVAKDTAVDEKSSDESIRSGHGFDFWGGIIEAAVTTSRLEIQSLDDIRTKGREYFAPRIEQMKHSFEPLKSWAEQKTESWRIEDSQRRAIGADYAKSLGLQQGEDGKWKSS